jgi:uncharacterized protein
VFFQVPGMIFSLWDRTKLAEDGGIADPGGWGGVTIGHCVGSPEDVEHNPSWTVRDGGSTSLRA